MDKRKTDAPRFSVLVQLHPATESAIECGGKSVVNRKADSLIFASDTQKPDLYHDIRRQHQLIL
jgi:hypothetical protein